MMKEYTVIYREKRNTKGQKSETSLTASNIAEAKKWAREDLGAEYTIVSVRLS